MYSHPIFHEEYYLEREINNNSCENKSRFGLPKKSKNENKILKN